MPVGGYTDPHRQVTAAKELLLARAAEWCDAQAGGTELDKQRAHYALIAAGTEWHAAVDEFAMWARGGRP